MGNKIVIDGKEYELSAELVEKIKAEVTAQEIERKIAADPFARMRSDDYYFITAEGCVCTGCETGMIADDERYSVANYCRDKGLMEQRALHETLNRLMWRYSEMHGGDGSWEGLSIHYHIRRWRDCGFKVSYCEDGKTNGVVYFNSRDVAEAAVEEVVKPFMEAHPEFVW